MVVHPGSDRVSRARPYSGTASGSALPVRLRGPNPVPPAFPCRSAPGGRDPPGAEAPGRAALQPPAARGPQAVERSPVWPSPPFARRYSGDLVIDFSSSGYLDVSVPPVPLPAPMDSGRGCGAIAPRVLPFGHPRIEGRVRLPGDYRGLPRPSSAPCAKASAVRPCHLPAPCAGHGIQR